MTHLRKRRLTLASLVAIALTACQGEVFQMPPLNPDSGATFRIYTVMYDRHGELARRPRGSAVLGVDTEQLTDRNGQTYFVSLPAIIDESCLEAISASRAPYHNQPVLNFQFDEGCTETFGIFTARHINKQMAVVLNGEMVSAPNIRSAITGGAFYIEGDFGSLEEAEAIAKTFY